jgi:hypothetical protein
VSPPSSSRRDVNGQILEHDGNIRLLSDQLPNTLGSDSNGLLQLLVVVDSVIDIVVIVMIVIVPVHIAVDISIFRRRIRLLVSWRSGRRGSGRGERHGC